MQYDEFIRSVAERADISREDADRLTAATLRTLAERITGGRPRIWRRSFPGS
ncbi:MAG: hypothetical protein JWM84_116 [Nocardioides sp.]|nr:hypothetical protein [Nocardioides sp.]